MKKNKFNHFLLALRESFIGMLPFVILISSSLILYQFLNYTGFEWSIITDKNILKIIVKLQELTPFILLISISYYFAVRYSIDYLLNIILSLTILITIRSFVELFNNPIINHSAISFFIILIPLTTTYLLKNTLKKSTQFSIIDIELNKLLNYIVPFILSYIVSVIFYLLLTYLMIYVIDYFNSSLISFSDNTLFFLRSFFNHLLWFIGLHGDNSFDMIVDNSYLYNPLFNGLNYKEFFDLFVIFGGSGVGLALIITIHFYSRDLHSKKIARLATPFALFNINEILIFGLPIILNKKLFIPFILAPIVNIIIAYYFLTAFYIEFTQDNIPWITPIFINSYLMTDGNFLALILQLFLLIVDIAIYIPFIHAYTSNQSFISHYAKLKKDLNITLPLKALEGVQSYKTKQKIIASNEEVSEIIELIGKGELLMFYQPKIDIKSNKCNHYEALSHLKIDGEKIVPPYFLENLEDGGLAPIIDTWVAKEVKKNLVAWRENSFTPYISINLHPDTIRNSIVLQEIIMILKGEKVEFELLEKDLYDDFIIKENILLLKKSGFKIAIDDFGTGFSSIKTLCFLPIDTLKIDKSLIDEINHPKSYSICKHLAEFCLEHHIDCVAEGVETKEQLALVERLGIKYVQGYYYSKAIQLEERFIP